MGPKCLCPTGSRQAQRLCDLARIGVGEVRLSDDHAV